MLKGNNRLFVTRESYSLKCGYSVDRNGKNKASYDTYLITKIKILVLNVPTKFEVDSSEEGIQLINSVVEFMECVVKETSENTTLPSICSISLKLIA